MQLHVVVVDVDVVDVLVVVPQFKICKIVQMISAVRNKTYVFLEIFHHSLPTTMLQLSPHERRLYGCQFDQYLNDGPPWLTRYFPPHTLLCEATAKQSDASIHFALASSSVL